MTEPAFETVFDPTGIDGDLGEGIVLRLGISQRGDEPVLRLRYRTDVLDTDSAARIAGYHLTALELMAADLDAVHRRQSLLSAEELYFQLEGLAGPRRELPDLRVHELFEERVEAYPDRVAAVCGDRSLTYGELNGRANRLARALLARGLGREGVVAVVAERNLDWLAAVLAVFKAGGVYLPVEPHFPADRIAAMLSRAGCGLVLTEPASTTHSGPGSDVAAGGRDALHRPRAMGRIMPTAIWASMSRRISWPISISRLVRPVSRRVRCVSTPAWSIICSRRSTIWVLVRDRWWRRLRRSVSTFRCGSWCLRCWWAAAP